MRRQYQSDGQCCTVVLDREERRLLLELIRGRLDAGEFVAREEGALLRLQAAVTSCRAGSSRRRPVRAR